MVLVVIVLVTPYSVLLLNTSGCNLCHAPGHFLRENSPGYVYTITFVIVPVVLWNTELNYRVSLGICLPPDLRSDLLL